MNMLILTDEAPIQKQSISLVQSTTDDGEYFVTEYLNGHDLVTQYGPMDSLKEVELLVAHRMSWFRDSRVGPDQDLAVRFRRIMDVEVLG